jgi:hypothetical protein
MHHITGSPQNGTIRRECLDHVIVFHEGALRRTLNSYFNYYERSRTHLSLDKDAPIPRRVQPPELGNVVELREVGELHHRYERRGSLACPDLRSPTLKLCGQLRFVAPRSNYSPVCQTTLRTQTSI